MREIVLELNDKSIRKVIVAFNNDDIVSITYTHDTDTESTGVVSKRGKRNVTGGNNCNKVGNNADDICDSINTKEEESGNSEDGVNNVECDKNTVQEVYRAKNRWTPERIKEFCEDYDKMSLREVSEKWGLTKSTCATTRSRFGNQIYTGKKD